MRTHAQKRTLGVQHTSGKKFSDALKITLNPCDCHKIFELAFQKVWLRQWLTNKINDFLFIIIKTNKKSQFLVLALLC